MFDFLLGNDLLSAVIAFILVLIPAVLIHELGHFFAAKAVGITILEFGIGMPPRMVRLFTLKGTDYTLNWLPLGGFVRPLGEDMVRQQGDEATNQDRAEALERGIANPMSVNEAPPLGRIFFMAAGALANFALAVVLFFIVALIGIPETIGGRVVVVEPSASMTAAGILPNDVVEQINGETFANSDAFIDRLYELDGQPVTVSLLRFDPAAISGELQADALPEPQPLEITFTPTVDGTAPAVESYPIILDVAADSPADTAGIEPNDWVETFNGERIRTFAELRELTQQNLGQEVTLTLIRGEERIEASLTPRENPPANQGSMGITSTQEPILVDAGSGLLFQEGVPQTVIMPQSFGSAASYSVAQVGEVLSMIARVPAEIIQGTLEPEAARPVSVIGIAQMGGVFLQNTVEENQPTIILNFIAIISIALGLTNLLPLPALDGGRILFVLLEIVRGRPIAPEREGLVHLVGLALLLSLMVVLMLNDLINPITEMIR